MVKEILVEREGPGRRKNDGVCVFHDDFKRLVNAAVSWKVLVLYLSILSAGIGTPVGILISNLKDAKQEINVALISSKKELSDADAILHRRISDSVDERVKAINDLNKTLNEISQKMSISIYRQDNIEKKLDQHILKYETDIAPRKVK